MRLRRLTRLAVALACASAVPLGALLALRVPVAVPDFAAVRAAYRPSEAYLLDRSGAVLDAERVDFSVRRLAWTPLEEVSPALVAAVVDGEDRRFWHHRGVDWLGVAAALRDRLRRRSTRGASTITMQLAALLEERARPHAGSRDLGEKRRQAQFALSLERRWSKRQVLEAYLNLVHFRGELEGIGAASRLLAHKAPSGLSVGESTVLAALLPNPGAAVPVVARRSCARARATGAPVRCGELLETTAMLLGRVADGAAAQRLAPHLARALLHRPGERVATTLDAGTQRLSLEALTRQLRGLGGRNVRDGAALVVDNASGDVLAYVGSAGPDSRAPAVDGVRAPRQAGSTLKPFLYDLALERRYLTAASLVDDSPISIDTVNGIYLPQDYDHAYKGTVSVRTALAASLNVPAVRTAMLVGVEALRERLHAVGYAGITRGGEYYGYALALGSAEVTLWEQAESYRTLALGGETSPLRLRADDPRPVRRRVLAEGASYVIGDVLSDPTARLATFGLNSSLNTAYWSAVKTGTSKDMRDNWCIGFTPRVTVAVWVGNFEGDPMQDVSGVTGAAPVWREIVDGLQGTEAAPPPRPPAGVTRAPVRFAADVESPRSEWFVTDTAPAAAIEAVPAAARSARIASPVDGMVIALDPDIPMDRQRVPVSVEGAAGTLAIRIDDAVAGRAGTPLLWTPRRGRHRFSLQDDSGRELDAAVVIVR